MKAVGGLVQTPVITENTLKLGDAVASQMVFVEADLPRLTGLGVPLLRLFGADFLSGYDVLSDLPKRQITLFRLKGCSAASLHWQEPVERLPFAESSPVRVTLPARLNGKSIDLMLDTAPTGPQSSWSRTKILEAPEAMVRIWMYGGIGSTVWRSGRISTAMKSLSSRRCRDPARCSVRIFCGGCRCGSRIVSGRLCCSGVTHQ